jgi:hypothetical protein
MSTWGEFGFAMLIATAITALGYFVAVLRYRAARAGYAALGAGLLMATWRTIGGTVGAVLGMVALWRGEPGTTLLWLGVVTNLLFALSFVYRMLRKGLRR